MPVNITLKKYQETVEDAVTGQGDFEEEQQFYREAFIICLSHTKLKNVIVPEALLSDLLEAISSLFSSGD
jgi:hypothetical protein